MLEENVFVGTNCQSFNPSKVQCDKEGNMPIHILDKYCEETDTRYNIYPLTVIQAIFDGVTGTRLDRILAACNSIYLTWEGTFADTVNKLDKIYRRKGYIITYRDELMLIGLNDIIVMILVMKLGLILTIGKDGLLILLLKICLKLLKKYLLI
jgi:hypothetical protein